jgi:hypothetical protein
VKTRGLLLFVAALLVVGLVPATASADAHRALTPAERRQINATMDAFVNHAVKRQGVDKAWNVVTPNFRLGESRKEWDTGDIQGFPYPAAGHVFHGWTVNSLQGNELGIQLILMPRKGATVGAAATLFTLKKINGRWLVDSMVPGAFFAPAGKPARVVGTNDFQAQNNGGNTPRLPTAGVSSNFAFIPIAVFGMIVLVLLVATLVGGFRWRKGRQGLPPLPERMRTRT